MTDFTSSDPRCLATLQKLANARAKMKKLGIRTLLNGHKGWATVKPMAEPQPEAKVISMRRRK